MGEFICPLLRGSSGEEISSLLYVSSVSAVATFTSPAKMQEEVGKCATCPAAYDCTPLGARYMIGQENCLMINPYGKADISFGSTPIIQNPTEKILKSINRLLHLDRDQQPIPTNRGYNDMDYRIRFSPPNSTGIFRLTMMDHGVKPRNLAWMSFGFNTQLRRVIINRWPRGQKDTSLDTNYPGFRLNLMRVFLDLVGDLGFKDVKMPNPERYPALEFAKKDVKPRMKIIVDGIADELRFNRTQDGHYLYTF